MIENDFSDGRCQGIIVITMLLNDILKCIENSSLGARSFIFLYSKVEGTTGILILLEEKIGVFKNEDTSFQIFREDIKERDHAYQLHE